VDPTSTDSPRPTPAIAPTRRRPFGVLVVALIQMITVVVAVVGSLTQWEMPWEGVFVTYLQEHAVARGAILALGIAIVAAVIGLWRLRYWGWALMVSIVGVSLALDLMVWWQGGSSTSLVAYGRLALDVVSAFYLNTSAVQDAFRPPRSPTTAPVVSTRSAGRVDP
jgi:hypothetical protein